jgi:hypothetical protein
MIDRVIASCGLDPRKSTDPQGWRRLSLGSAECRAGVIPWSPTERYLVVFSPLLRLPTKSRQLGKLGRLLLELNHEASQEARFSIHGEILFVAIARPIRGLDEVEMEEWHRKGLPIVPGENGIALKARVADTIVTDLHEPASLNRPWVLQLRTASSLIRNSSTIIG